MHGTCEQSPKTIKQMLFVFQTFDKIKVRLYKRDVILTCNGHDGNGRSNGATAESTDFDPCDHDAATSLYKSTCLDLAELEATGTQGHR